MVLGPGAGSPRLRVILLTGGSVVGRSYDWPVHRPPSRRRRSAASRRNPPPSVHGRSFAGGQPPLRQAAAD
jgi:hypothetical protein